MRRSFLTVLILAALGAAGGGVYVLFHYYEPLPPSIVWMEPPEVIGREALVGAMVSDEGLGLREVVAVFQQGSVSREIFRRTFPGPPDVRTPLMEAEVEIPFAPVAIGGKDGRAKVALTVSDRSWKHRKQGNQTTADLNLVVSTRPPRGEVLTSQHNVFRGGMELVVYRAPGPRIVESGVKVGDFFFPGSQSRTAPDTYAAFFAIPYDAPGDVAPVVWIKDSLGNFATIPFYFRVQPKRFPTDTVNVTPQLLQKLRSEYALDPDLSDADAFLAINRDMRKQDHEKLKDLCRVSRPERLWKGTFLRLLNAAPKANFAEHRTYLLAGTKIDEQDHLGCDLASVANAPVTPAESGVVVFAGELGIYGNTVVLDHGMGIFTLYGHLSAVLAPEAGQAVTPATVIGRTGMTGLAMGDHLHYAVLLYGMPVNPIEWWDPLWIRWHVEPKLKLLEPPVAAAAPSGDEASSAVPSPSPAPSPAPPPSPS